MEGFIWSSTTGSSCTTTPAASWARTPLATPRDRGTPWSPEGVDVPAGSPVLRSGGFVGLRAFMEEYGELLGRVGWASETSLFRGLRPGLCDEVGWVRVEGS
jgi:hypothetical protein